MRGLPRLSLQWCCQPCCVVCRRRPLNLIDAGWNRRHSLWPLLRTEHIMLLCPAQAYVWAQVRCPAPLQCEPQAWMMQSVACRGACWPVTQTRVSCPRQRAMPVQLVRGPEQAQGHTSPSKNRCDKQVSSWRHISCHTDKNRYYT